uniref:DNA polymerase alpha subunit B n=1 Tax=Kalanchoe fedtschenkoi TaxID=63787 RepID=A0A7N0VL44_KALFE
MEEEIKAEFLKSGFTVDNEAEVLKKCLAFCINCKLSASDLVSSWEAYYLNRQLDEPVVYRAQMDGFLIHLQDELRDAVIKEEQHLHVYSMLDVDAILNGDEEDTKDGILGTPIRSAQNKAEADDSMNYTFEENPTSRGRAETVTPYGQRKKKFVVLQTGCDLPALEGRRPDHGDDSLEDEIISRVRPGKRCSLQVHGSKPESGCRFMYEIIEDRFNFLEGRILKHASVYHASGLYDEPTDGTVASQKSVMAVGMICCDGEGHLNEKSTLLQCSVEHSGGQRVRIDLQKLSQFSIFPGQVVGIEGNNPSGHCFVASKIIDYIPCLKPSAVDFPPAKKLDLDPEFASTYQENVAELSMIIAAGPFTTIDNLFFEPLSDLLAYARIKLPQLLVLMGPFIDSEHPEIRKCSVNATFDEIFQLEILKKLQDFVEYTGSSVRVLLVPSTRDAHHDYVFPQPPFDVQPPDVKLQIISITNPGMFDANEVNVGCCTADILKHISAEMMSRKPADGLPWDGRSKLANHIIAQRSFYPLYPPAEVVPLDLSLAPETLTMTAVPDILILPSDLAPFVK